MTLFCMAHTINATGAPVYRKYFKTSGIFLECLEISIQWHASIKTNLSEIKTAHKAFVSTLVQKNMKGDHPFSQKTIVSLQ